MSISGVLRAPNSEERESGSGSERLGRWFAPVEGDVRLGGRFTIHSDDGDLAGCRVTACDRQRNCSWEWPQNTGFADWSPVRDRYAARLAEER